MSSEVRAASLVHELRQPLFALKARLQLAAEQGLPADEVGCLLASVAHMEQLVEHYAGRDGGAATELPTFDLAHVAVQAVSMVEERARRDGVELVVRLPDEPVAATGRATAVRQVLVNLLLNAVEAVAEAEERRVEIEVSGAGGQAAVSVRDSGRGLADEIQGREFEPFVTTKDPTHTTGLGLFITRELLREVRGALTLDAGESGGLCARVELPMRG